MSIYDHTMVCLRVYLILQVLASVKTDHASILLSSFLNDCKDSERTSMSALELQGYVIPFLT
jgi:hypothetical protein